MPPAELEAVPLAAVVPPVVVEPPEAGVAVHEQTRPLSQRGGQATLDDRPVVVHPSRAEHADRDQVADAVGHYLQ